MQNIKFDELFINSMKNGNLHENYVGQGLKNIGNRFPLAVPRNRL